MLTTAKTPGMLRRAWLTVRAWHLQFLIDSAEADIQYHESMAELAPRAAAVRRQYRDELRIMLIDCELKPQRRTPAALVKAAEFWQVFRQYRRWHGTRYALQRAYHIVYQGADF